MLNEQSPITTTTRDHYRRCPRLFSSYQHFLSVFDVDIADGEPARKLPYNRTDNPYTVADKWLLKEGLPLSHRQQIVEFILQNTGQKGFSFDSSFQDPYTGSHAYVPGQSSIAQGAVPVPIFNHIPKKGMLFFDSAQFDGILKKISEFNKGFLTDGENSLSFSELELSRLAAIVKILKDTSRYNSSSFADVDITILLKILKSWPVQMLFPVIDILRMIVLHPNGATLFHKHIESENAVLMETLAKVTTTPQPANLLTIIRLITKFFEHSCFTKWLQSHCSQAPLQPDGAQCGYFILGYMRDIIEDVVSIDKPSLRPIFAKSIIAAKEIDEVHSEWAFEWAEYIQDHISDK